ncbi:DUF1552 domain-containing protein [Allorhodopirellula solitaria]|nr:DUF1552 domain-containing protein [Allorhodopirellula solitaria]
MSFLQQQNLRNASLSRRTLLRGTGAALALPWLEAMMPRRATASTADPQANDQAPVRMAALFVPNGVRQDKWTPAGEGREFELSSTLEPLADVRDQLLVLTNLWNQASNAGDGHYVKTSGFLTCTTINKSLGIDLNCNGQSMDQVAAASAEHLTPLPSLELGMDPVTTGVDTNVGYTRVYGSHIAWKGPTTPLARELNPHLVYERLLRSARPGGKSSERDTLLLDQVIDDAKQLSKSLGVEDRRRMDEYLQSVRSIEKRLSRQKQAGALAWKPRVSMDSLQAPPKDVPDEFPEHVRLMLDMMAIAFQTDTTRVSTFMFGNAVSGRSFAFLDGVTGGHHDTSHHQNSAEKLAQYEIITRWHVQQYAYLLNKLQSMKEGEKTVLDNSMILFGSGLRDGNSHSPRNLPILLGGNAGGRIATGQHLSFSPNTPLSNLYLAMLNAFGNPTNQFADSTGVLPGVLAS